MTKFFIILALVIASFVNCIPRPGGGGTNNCVRAGVALLKEKGYNERSEIHDTTFYEIVRDLHGKNFEFHVEPDRVPLIMSFDDFEAQLVLFCSKALN